MYVSMTTLPILPTFSSSYSNKPNICPMYVSRTTLPILPTFSSSYSNKPNIYPMYVSRTTLPILPTFSSSFSKNTYSRIIPYVAYIAYLTHILQFILQEQTDYLLKNNTVRSLHRILTHILQFILQEQTDYLLKNNTVRSLHRIPYPHSPVHTPKTTRRSRSKSSCVSAECTKFAFV
jgi:hypothetical protein